MEVSFKFPLGTTASAVLAAIAAHYGMSVPNAQVGTSATDTTPEDNTPNPSPPQVDGEHLPWDARIHSDSKALTDKGVWRKRRGVDPISIANVTAELKARIATHPAASQATVQTSQPPAAPAAGPAMPAMTPPGLPALTPAPKTAFDQFVDFTMQHIQTPTNPTGRVTAEWIGQLIAHFGVTEGTMSALQHQPDEKIAAIRAGMAQSLGLPVGS